MSGSTPYDRMMSSTDISSPNLPVSGPTVKKYNSLSDGNDWKNLIKDFNFPKQESLNVKHVVKIINNVNTCWNAELISQSEKLKAKSLQVIIYIVRLILIDMRLQDSTLGSFCLCCTMLYQFYDITYQSHTIMIDCSRNICCSCWHCCCGCLLLLFLWLLFFFLLGLCGRKITKQKY